MKNSEILKRLFRDYTRKFLDKLVIALIFSLILAGSTSSIAYLLDPAIEKIPMRDMDQCQIMGAQWISSPRAFDGRYNYEKMAFICLEE